MRAWGWVLGASIIGCSGQVRVMSPSAPGEATEASPASGARSIAIVQGPQAGCDGEALGVIDVPFSYDDADGSRAALRAEAARRGADAVIDVKRVTTSGEEHVLGTAVRCRALREERPYDVLARIDVPEVEGDAAGAFAALRARAYALNADLVIDVRLARDDADHAHVTGVAIKYR